MPSYGGQPTAGGGACEGTAAAAGVNHRRLRITLLPVSQTNTVLLG